MKHPVGQTRSGVPVYIDLIRSPAARIVAGQPHILELVREVLGRVEISEAEVGVEHDMGRLIGYSFVVETSDEDTIFYAQLVKDNTYTRFVKNGKPLSTRYLTIMLRRDSDNEYELHDTWIGQGRPPRPGSDSATAASKRYWSKHAVILADQSLQLRTVTKVCPY